MRTYKPYLCRQFLPKKEDGVAESKTFLWTCLASLDWKLYQQILSPNDSLPDVRLVQIHVLWSSVHIIWNFSDWWRFLRYLSENFPQFLLGWMIWKNMYLNPRNFITKQHGIMISQPTFILLDLEIPYPIANKFTENCRPCEAILKSFPSFQPTIFLKKTSPLKYQGNLGKFTF